MNFDQPIVNPMVVMNSVDLNAIELDEKKEVNKFA